MAKAKSNKAQARAETDQYFEGMEPPKITELDRLLKAREDAKSQLAAAEAEMELAEDRLSKSMHKHAEKLEKDAKGHLRYLCKPMQLIATIDVKEAKEVIKVKSAPKAKAPSA